MIRALVCGGRDFTDQQKLQQVLALLHIVVAFPGGIGTAMLVNIAKEAGVDVKEIQ